MEESNKELLEYIYKTAEMGKYSSTELLKELHNKDNKIKEELDEIVKGYEEIYKKTEKLLKKHKLEEKEINYFAKMGASFNMKKEVMNDNSDASIADMLIQGLTMGNLEMSKKIGNYEKKVDDKILDLAKELHKFGEKEIEKLKKFL